MNCRMLMYVCIYVCNKKLKCEAMYELYKFFSYIHIVWYYDDTRELQKSTTCIDQDGFQKFNGGN